MSEFNYQVDQAYIHVLEKKIQSLEAKNKVLMKEMKRISEIYEEASSDIAKEAIKKCEEIDNGK